MLLVLALIIAPQDTVRLDAAAVLARAVERAPIAAASAARVAAAQATARGLGRWNNPELGVLAENLGAQREVTGRDGLAGTEGQVTLALPLGIGGDVGARRALGQAGVTLAEAESRLWIAELRAVVLEALVRHARVHASLDAARTEARTLEAMGAAMTLQAAEGRASEGAAARVRVEATLAASAASRRAAEAAVVDADIAARLGLAAGTPLRVTAAACEAPSGGTTAVRAALAAARVGVAEAEVGTARAARVPDLFPQIGFRRSAGFSGLLLGLTVDLPLFNAGGASLDAALAARAQADAERAEVDQRLLALEAGHRGALAALDARSGRYGPAWAADLDLAVEAAAARWREGAGTLAEVLEARRARLAALDEHAAWIAARAEARIGLARATGAPLEAALLADACTGAHP